jgi:transposase
MRTMKAYSMDLRKRVVQAVDNKEGTHKEIAKTFRVSKAFLEKLLKQRRERGSIEALPHGGGQVPLLDESKESLIANRVEGDNDATLEELCEYLENKTKLRVSISTMCRVLQRLELRRKKNSVV